MKRKFTLLAALLAVLTGAASACGGDDDDVTPAPTAASAAASPSPSAQPTPSLADVIARNPQYFIYIVAAGDTLATIANTFDGQAGPPPATFTDALKALNQLSGEPQEGQPLAIPLRQSGTLALFPDASIEAALGIGGAGEALVLLQPSLALRDTYQNRIVLHTVVLADANPGGEGRGYLMQYYLADRPPFKGGSADPQARVVERLFTIGAGALAKAVPSTPAETVHRFTRNGVEYALQTGPGALHPAATIATQLQTAAER
ncbi:MAG: LysM peptidoglycan-binding domain-containing protein [Thermoflexaceae bacterium]|nr:LysM peptidoglycan-binding domain-containing protein [Thermoflexaceae bacterium]